MATVTANDASPPRFDLGTLVGQSAALVRSRWPALALVFALGVAPRLALEALDEDHGVASRALSVFAAHAADRLGAALVSHLAEAVLLAVCLAPARPGAIAGACRAVLRAGPTLIWAWVICESDTMVRLWNDWTQTFAPSGYLAQLGLIALDIGAGMTVVSLLGLFSPVVLFERLGLAGAVSRAWRLMQGARGRLAALYLVMNGALVFVALPLAFLGLWVTEGDHAPDPPWLSVVGHALFALISCSWSVLIAAAYLEQRRLHEGALPEQIADTFG